MGLQVDGASSDEATVAKASFNPTLKSLLAMSWAIRRISAAGGVMNCSYGIHQHTYISRLCKGCYVVQLAELCAPKLLSKAF